MSEVKPITPNEIVDDLDKIIPSVVITAVNNILKSKYRGTGPVTIKQKDIVAEIMRLDGSITKDEIFDNKYMDFEKLYRKNGWIVEYDKPAYCETYDAFFTFKLRK